MTLLHHAVADIKFKAGHVQQNRPVHTGTPDTTQTDGVNWAYSMMSSASRYDTIRDAILTCARKPTRVGLIYRTEPTTEKCKNRKTKK